MTDKGFSINNKILEFSVSTQDNHIREKLEIENKDESSIMDEENEEDYDSTRNDDDFDDSTDEDLKDLVIIDEDELELEE